ncbi:hypothetical protein L6452_15611 [Arctium lappa]|uniref:Uncharacterized protein n=1 Tax=Arctium lappa TaxID=4217 RepID=A0ACB9CP35_ARCLA|nr:hypothetical protein L6452_15611 [Arctium lappa]
MLFETPSVVFISQLLPPIFCDQGFSQLPLHILDQFVPVTKMASDASIQMIDDDDDFDWEAAVREIDVACDEATNKQSSTAATTSAAPFGSSNLQMGSGPKTENNKPSSSRQSTLDRFIGFTGSKSANQDAIHDAQDKVECDDERVSSVRIDHEAAKTWIYPGVHNNGDDVGEMIIWQKLLEALRVWNDQTFQELIWKAKAAADLEGKENVPVREYQVSITRTALFSNTLVSLPTGLGKTLIAAVVMYNYFRWFPEGKIVFAAPSRPLVMQQIEACHNIVGIPQEWTVYMTGQTMPATRADLWKAKRIFFVTPQVLEKDIQSGKSLESDSVGSCVMKQLVCLVIDEAHRASGNYSYCVAVRELMAVSVQLRILALTATPGSNHQTVQQVIDNLQISSLEHRSESDPDVSPYVHERKIELIQVAMGKDAVEANSLLMDVIRPLAARLSSMGVLPKRDIQALSPRDFLISREDFRKAPPHNLPDYKRGEIEGIYGALITLSHIRKLLSAHGIGPACEMLEEKLKQGYLLVDLILKKWFSQHAMAHIRVGVMFVPQAATTIIGKCLLFSAHILCNEWCGYVKGVSFGSLARLLRSNEALDKAKRIMKQSLSHGALSPKFTKMIEVLIEHFSMSHDLFFLSGLL